MMSRRHAFLAQLARERGYLDPARYGEVLSALDGLGEEESFESFWVGGGWLLPDQLDELLRPAPTRKFGEEPIARAATAALPLSGGRPHDTGPIPSAPPDDDPGSLPPIPRYQPSRVIGVGGMGNVWEVLDERLARRVALKMPRKGADPSVAKALAREALVVGSLEHPSIIPVYDAGEVEGLGPFYAMRLLEQPTLEDVIGRLYDEDEEAVRKYGLLRLLRYYVQICQAVDYAHSRGIVHCDLKPANVVVGDFGEVLILDWGLAFKLEEGIANRGGTPGYMAPEQLRAGAPVDVRADIFGLGSILYEILCYRPAYDRHVTSLMIEVAAETREFPEPEPPRLRKEGVPEELEQVCLKAMSLDPEKRHQSAAALAADVEAFLEGTRERERREKRAEELVGQGDQLAEMYSEYVESRPRLLDEVRIIRAAIAPWAAADDKRELWDAEDRLAATDAVGVRTLQAAVASFEQALDERPGHSAARRGLAQLYSIEAQRARERRDEHDRIYFEELVKQYADDVTLLSGHEGALTVRCLDGDAEIGVAALEEVDRRLVPVRERALGTTPASLRLPAGSYAVSVRRGHAAASFPVLLTPGGEALLDVELAVIDSLAPGERYVPGGPALLGGDEQSRWGRELVSVDVPPFVISEKPVTFAEYLAFLEEVRENSPDELAAHLPTNAAGVPHWQWNPSSDSFVPSPNFNFTREEALELPAFGVTLDSAQAYASWRLLKTGHTYRLPREDEWEKAARGVDGRVFPWGDYFDAAFCKMYQSREGAARPEAPGAFAFDASPYGVHDLAGGVADWVIGPDDDSPHVDVARVDVARGGAWCDGRADCRLGTRRPYQRGVRTARVGFRLARDP